jgi:transcriptional regulator with XRE-family HTH domain
MSEEAARLAKALVDFREAEGISERELAHRTGLSHATIRMFEHDDERVPTPFAARRFEEVLGWVPGSIKSAPPEAEVREPSTSSGPVAE